MGSDAEIAELDIDILRAVAAGQLPDAGLLDIELRRLQVLGLIDINGGGRLASRVTALVGHAIEIANSECVAG